MKYLARWNFKYWSDFVKYIGDEKKELCEEDFIQRYIQIKNKIGRKLKRTDWNMKNGVEIGEGIYFVENMFGSWENLLREVGDSNKKEIKNEDFKKQYFKLKKDLKRDYLFLRDWISIDYGLSMASLKKRFGTWNNFLNYVGDKNYHERKKEEFLNDYKSFFKKLKRRPTATEYAKTIGLNYNGVLYRYKIYGYKSWENFCEEMEKQF